MIRRRIRTKDKLPTHNTPREPNAVPKPEKPILALDPGRDLGTTVLVSGDSFSEYSSGGYIPRAIIQRPRQQGLTRISEAMERLRASFVNFSAAGQLAVSAMRSRRPTFMGMDIVVSHYVPEDTVIVSNNNPVVNTDFSDIEARALAVYANGDSEIGPSNGFARMFAKEYTILFEDHKPLISEEFRREVALEGRIGAAVARDPKQRALPHARFLAENQSFSRRMRKKVVNRGS